HRTSNAELRTCGQTSTFDVQCSMFDVSSRMKTPKPKRPTPKKSQALSPKRNGPFQYWCLMGVVLYLCGCASGRTIVSTNDTPRGTGPFATSISAKHRR